MLGLKGSMCLNSILSGHIYQWIGSILLELYGSLWFELEPDGTHLPPDRFLVLFRVHKVYQILLGSKPSICRIFCNYCLIWWTARIVALGFNIWLMVSGRLSKDRFWNSPTKRQIDLLTLYCTLIWPLLTVLIRPLPLIGTVSKGVGTYSFSSSTSGSRIRGGYEFPFKN